MAGMGPPPKPDGQRRRRNATIAMTQLPAEGRQGPPPPWPLSTKLTKTQQPIWAQLWSTPQAVAWERLGVGGHRVVARYTRMLARAERPGDVPGPVLVEVRQLEDRLGLTPMAMLRLRWEIVADEMSARRPAPGRQADSGGDRRRRLAALAAESS